MQLFFVNIHFLAQLIGRTKLFIQASLLANALRCLEILNRYTIVRQFDYLAVGTIKMYNVVSF